MDPVRRLGVAPTNRLAMSVTLIPRQEFAAARRARRAPEISPQSGTPFAMARDVLVAPNRLPCNPPPWGALTAVDLGTGTIVEHAFAPVRPAGISAAVVAGAQLGIAIGRAIEAGAAVIEPGPIGGWLPLVVILALVVAGPLVFVRAVQALSAGAGLPAVVLLIVSILDVLAAAVGVFGFMAIAPNDARVLLLFGYALFMITRRRGVHAARA